VRLKQYLLGELAEAEQEQIEMALLESAETLAELEDAEDELIESYLSGTLAPEDKARFEAHFLLSEDHRRSLTAARWLREMLLSRAALERRPATMVKPFWLKLAASLALVTAAAFWLLRREDAPAPEAHRAEPAPARPRRPPRHPGPRRRRLWPSRLCRASPL
jgi:hypothetical protein